MEYDLPTFKVLARNDTSSAPGHQGGVVIPKAISDYFPQLQIPSGSAQPTVDKEVFAELFLEDEFRGRVTTRYQYQTWGGTRTPERRLTSNLGMIRDAASAGDVLIFEKSIDAPDHMRISLYRRSMPAFALVQSEIGNRNWGALQGKPVSNTEIAAAEQEQHAAALLPFKLFAERVERKPSITMRIARERTFRGSVISNFMATCAISRRMLINPKGGQGIDAAHIIPLERHGTNDVRNGLALSKELHWAFDEGLIGVLDGKVRVADRVRSDPRNNYLAGFEGAPITRGKIAGSPDDSALHWHLANRFQK